MPEVSVYEARNNLSRLIKKAQAGRRLSSPAMADRWPDWCRRTLPLIGPQLTSWLRRKHADPALARTQEQADADLAVERADW